MHVFELRDEHRPQRWDPCSPSYCVLVVHYKHSLCQAEITCHNIWTAAGDRCVFALFCRHWGQRSGLIKWTMRILGSWAELEASAWMKHTAPSQLMWLKWTDKRVTAENLPQMYNLCLIGAKSICCYSTPLMDCVWRFIDNSFQSVTSDLLF